MTKSDDAAFATNGSHGFPQTSFGLTKREYIAAIALQGLLANGFFQYTDAKVTSRCVETAVAQADALIKELNKGGA